MYDFKEVEKKWQDIWEKNGCFNALNDSEKPHYYILVEFPYPSGSGLHVGHVRSYTAQDAMARMKRMQGYNVLYPMGYDSFGAPAEQYAIKTHQHPKNVVKQNVETFSKQMKSIGFSFDWSRAFSTSDPEYYKWTQWQFLQFYKMGMAYKADVPVNWCPTCKTVLSNEDAAGGVCERCGSSVELKEKSQWMLKMSDYAEDLLAGLEDTNFADRVKLGQINWIGKSTGASVVFKLKEVKDTLEVYTTRPDTIFGTTYMVISPEHEYLNKYKDIIKNMDEISKYQNDARKKSELERTELNKEKTGVLIDGLTAINPVTEKEMPIFVSDYVLAGYGTGAVMGVPAHDTRDYEFAKKFGLEIIEVIEGGDISKEAYTGDGIHVNSDFLNGLNKEDSIKEIIDYMEKKKCGTKKTNYKMRDWIFSRQRFWGEPIPMIYCDKCGWVPMNEEDLPLVLPDVPNYEPTETGESPLAAIEEFVNTTCPKCGSPAKRETDTMPNWAGSSWYFLRFMDAHNKEEFASMDAMKYWDKVDWYNGGMEHTARHLLYARFWVQMLYKLGLVPNKEMIWTRVSHGMILGSDNQKMSKSKGNVINPDDIINEYGADTLRLYEMFMGDYQMDAPWNTDSLKGCKRFIDRVIKLFDKVNNEEGYTESVVVLQNQTIKKVQNDLCNLGFNTAVSTLMILANKYDELDSITKKDYQLLLQLLNPIAPHFTEEMNEKLGFAPLYETPWPEYDEAKTVESVVTIAVQVNGKLRATLNVDKNISKEELLEIAKKEENVLKFIEGHEIVKEIVIPGRIVNLVIK